MNVPSKICPHPHQKLVKSFQFLVIPLARCARGNAARLKCRFNSLPGCQIDPNIGEQRVIVFLRGTK
jgi:hypothetical protein